MLKQEVCVRSSFRSLFSKVLRVADREVQRILLELLNQMDGFDQSVNVKVSELLW
jgi:ATP-dependent 26S proteasome regulatory subunit